MARLFTCGFEENNLLETMWTATDASALILQTATVHSGTYAVETDPAVSTSNTYKKFPAGKTSGSVFTRFYFRTSAWTNGNRVGNLANFGNSANSWVMTMQAGTILRLTNSTDNSTIDTGALNVNQWYRVETRTLISDTVGEQELLIDGSSIGTLTGKDTMPSNVGIFKLGHNTSGGTKVFYDDIAINDDSGTFQNSFPGPGKIFLVKPDGDDTVAWTSVPATGTNAQDVDDVPGAPDDLTTYNHISNLTSVDKLTLQNLGVEVPSDADLVLADVYGRQGSNGTSGQRSIIYKIWDDVDPLTDGPACSVDLNGWRIADTDEHLVLDLGARTKANFDTFKVGYKGNQGAATLKRVTAQWVNVEWIESAGGIVLLDGTAAAVSSLAGALPVDKKLGATIAATSTLAGDLPVSRLMVSTVAAVSSLAGALPVDKGLASTVPATSSLAGALALEWALAGTVPAVSTLTGDLTVPGEIVLSGVIPATSSLAGELPVERLMASTVAAVSTLDAILGKYRAIAGSIDAVSTLTGDLQRLRALAGAIAGGSTLAGALKLEWALRGVLAGAAVVSGDLTVELGFPWTRERLLTAKDISGPALRAPHRKEIT